MSTASEPPPPRIRAYSDLEVPEALRSQIEEILLVSANPRRVADEASRAAFLDRWLTPYLFGVLDDRTSRHLQRIFVAIVDDAQAREHAGLDSPLLVVDLYRNFERTGLRVDDGAHPCHIRNGALSREGIDIDGHGLPRGKLSVFAFRYVEVGDERVKARHPE